MDNETIKITIGDFECPGEKPDCFSRVAISFGRHDFGVDLSKELAIEEADLINEMVKHAGNYGWWASLNAQAKRMLRSRRRAYESVLSRLDLEARSSLEDKGIKVTEAGVKAWMNNDPRVKEDAEGLTAIEDLVELTDCMLRGLEHKRDMLKEISRLQCSEYYNSK